MCSDSIMCEALNALGTQTGYRGERVEGLQELPGEAWENSCLVNRVVSDSAPRPPTSQPWLCHLLAV